MNFSFPLTVLALLLITLPIHAQSPSPVDRLDPAAIDEDDRRSLAIPELVAYNRPHGRGIAHVAIAPDGKLLASCGLDNIVHLQKLGGKEPVSWAKLDGSYSGIAFSLDGKWLATGCADTQVIIWDLTGEKPKQEHKLSGHKARPFALAFSPKGKMLVSGSADPVMRLWKLDDLTPEVWGVINKESGGALGISSLAFSHNGKYLVTGSLIGKETLRVWDASGNFLEEKAMPPAEARLVACAPTEPLIAFVGDDGEIHLWKLGDRFERLRQWSAHKGKGFGCPVKALAFSPDGKTLASAGVDKRLRLWNVADGEKRREWMLPAEPRALAFASDGRHLAIGNSDGTLCVFRLTSVKIEAK
jgi:WD40 repeat protein